MPAFTFATLLLRFRARRRLRGVRMFRLVRGLARSRRLLCLRGLSPGGFGLCGLCLPLRGAYLRLLRLLCLARLRFALGIRGAARLFGLLHALLVGAGLFGALLPRLCRLLIPRLAIGRGALRLRRTLCLLGLLLALPVGDLPVARCALRIGGALGLRGALCLCLPLRVLDALPVGRLLGLSLLRLELLRLALLRFALLGFALLRQSLRRLGLRESLLRLSLLLRSLLLDPPRLGLPLCRLGLGEALLRLCLLSGGLLLDLVLPAFGLPPRRIRLCQAQLRLRLLLRSLLLGKPLLCFGLALCGLRLREALLHDRLFLPHPLAVGAGRSEPRLRCEHRLSFAHRLRLAFGGGALVGARLVGLTRLLQRLVALAILRPVCALPIAGDHARRRRAGKAALLPVGKTLRFGASPCALLRPVVGLLRGDPCMIVAPCRLLRRLLCEPRLRRRDRRGLRLPVRPRDGLALLAA